MDEPPRSVVKRLFALSGNCCAFPECPQPIVEESGTVTGIICHIRAKRPGGPRYDSKQTAEQRHSFENLVLMCSRHSKVIDSEPRLYTVDRLEGFKSGKTLTGENELSIADGKKVDLLLIAYRDVYITSREVTIGLIKAEKVVFTKAKEPKIAAPETAIGSDLLLRNYMQHLIDRYNEFAIKQPKRKGFSFASIYSLVKKRYGVRKWELVPLIRFTDFSTLLQQRIDSTWLGSINRSKDQKNYSSLEEYRRKYYDK
jgi:hypothetical protein